MKDSTRGWLTTGLPRPGPVREVPRPVPLPRGLYRRLVGWGLLTGMLSGAAVGFVLGVETVVTGDLYGALIIGGPVWGAVLGMVVALVPTMIGTSIVCEQVRQRLPFAPTAAEWHEELWLRFWSFLAMVDVLVLGPVVYGLLNGDAVLRAVLLGSELLGNLTALAVLRVGVRNVVHVIIRSDERRDASPLGTALTEDLEVRADEAGFPPAP